MSSQKPDNLTSQTSSSRPWLEQSGGDPHNLAELLRPEKKLFASADLGQMLIHQLATLLAFHWAELNNQLAREVASLSPEERSSLSTFGALLAHPHPPIALLQLLKDYAKAMLKHPDELLPQGLASVLYFTAIAAARNQGADKITELSEAGIRKGIKWALDQKWVGEPCRGVLERGLSQSA